MFKQLFDSKINSIMNIKIILVLFSVNIVYSLKYHYITSDGVIHTSDAPNGTIPDVSKDTVALLIYENNINKTGY